MAPAQPEWTLGDFIHRGPWWKHSGIFLLNICLLLPLLTAWSNGLDSSMINGLQILPAWGEYFQNPQDKVLGFLNSAQNIGSLVCLPIMPYLCDRYGRKPMVLLGALITLGGVAWQATSTHVELFAAARILLGIGLTLSCTASPLLITELAYPTQRGKFSGAYNACFYIGTIANAWTVYGTYRFSTGGWVWRIPIVAQAISPTLQLLFIWFIPESPRYLMSRGKVAEATEVLARFHSHGNQRDPLVVFEVAQIRHALRMEEELVKNQPYSALLATPGNRKRLAIIVAIAVFSQWSGNGLISYYSHLVYDDVGIKNPATQAALNGGLGMLNLTCAMTGAMLVDRLGRRTLFLISNTGMLVVFSAFTIAVAVFNQDEKKYYVAGKAAIPLIFLFNIFYDIAYTPLLIVYTLEILPFTLRAKGFAVLNLTLSFTIAFNQFVNPVAIRNMGWWYYLVYVGFLAFELFIVLRYIIETKGRTLEETAALFDGEPVELVTAGGHAATHQSAFTISVNLRSGPHDLDADSKNDASELDGRSCTDAESQKDVTDVIELSTLPSVAGHTDSRERRTRDHADTSPLGFCRRESDGSV